MTSSSSIIELIKSIKTAALTGVFAVLLINNATRSLHAQTASNKSAPFGVTMGTPLAEVKRLSNASKEVPYVYTMRAIPRPHPDFEALLVMASPAQGVCKLNAIGKTSDTNVYGEGLKAVFERVKTGLEAKYGTANVIDQLGPGSIWSDPQDWTMALLKDERTLAAYWQRTTASLPHDIENILLEVSALSTSRGYVTLKYEFTNFQACKKEIEAKKNDVF